MQEAKQQPLSGRSNQHSTTSSSTETTPNNTEVIQQLQGTGPELPKTDLGQSESGSSFAAMAGGLLDSIAPAEGSGVKLVITGAIPLYKSPGIDVTFKPSLSMGVENKFGKMRASMQLAAGVEVSAGVDAWLFELKGAIEATFSGTLTIFGDSGTEIFEEFLLSLRYLIENACETVYLPDRFKDPIVTGIMSNEDMQNTIDEMDDKDKVQLDLEASLKGTASANDWKTTASAKVGHSLILRNDGNDELEAAEQKSVSVQVGPFTGTRKWLDGKTLDILNAKASIPIFGQTADTSVTAILSNQELQKVTLTASVSKELTLDMIKNLLFGDDGWMGRIKDSVVKGIVSINKQMDNPLLQDLAGKLGSAPSSLPNRNISPTGDALSKTGISIDGRVSVQLATDLIWQKDKGLLFRVRVSTNNSASVGVGDNKIEITQNDRLMSASFGEDGLAVEF